MMTEEELNKLESIPKLDSIDLEKKLFELGDNGANFLFKIKFVMRNQNISLLRAQMVVMNSSSYKHLE